MTDATLVDTSVLLDIATDDPDWFDWSDQQLGVRSSLGALLINDVVYAEASVRFPTVEATETFLNTVEVELDPVPKTALFLAGKAHRQYRQAGGTRRGVLSDFFIGAHASVRGMPVLTRDPARFRTYFPDVLLITPVSA